MVHESYNLMSGPYQHRGQAIALLGKTEHTNINRFDVGNELYVPKNYLQLA
jgi:hypothetical protein